MNSAYYTPQLYIEYELGPGSFFQEHIIERSFLPTGRTACGNGADNTRRGPGVETHGAVHDKFFNRIILKGTYSIVDPSRQLISVQLERFWNSKEENG
jgi:hypothetical protein